jgi:hypothetical protein
VAGIEFESFIVGEYCSAEYMNLRNSSAASLFLLVADTAHPAPAWFAVQCRLPGAIAGVFITLYSLLNAGDASLVRPCGVQLPLNSIADFPV